MSTTDIKMADRVKVEQQCQLAVSVKATVNADTDLATILGVDVPDAAEYIDIVVEGDTILRIQVGAAADANAAGIPDGAVPYRIYGDKTFLDTLQFYTGGANACSFFVFSRITGA